MTIIFSLRTLGVLLGTVILHTKAQSTVEEPSAEVVLPWNYERYYSTSPSSQSVTTATVATTTESNSLWSSDANFWDQYSEYFQSLNVAASPDENSAEAQYSTTPATTRAAPTTTQAQQDGEHAIGGDTYSDYWTMFQQLFAPDQYSSQPTTPITTVMTTTTTTPTPTPTVPTTVKLSVNDPYQAGAGSHDPYKNYWLSFMKVIKEIYQWQAANSVRDVSATPSDSYQPGTVDEPSTENSRIQTDATPSENQDIGHVSQTPVPASSVESKKATVQGSAQVGSPSQSKPIVYREQPPATPDESDPGLEGRHSGTPDESQSGGEHLSIQASSVEHSYQGVGPPAPSDVSYHESETATPAESHPSPLYQHLELASPDASAPVANAQLLHSGTREEGSTITNYQSDISALKAEGVPVATPDEGTPATVTYQASEPGTVSDSQTMEAYITANHANPPVSQTQHHGYRTNIMHHPPIPTTTTHRSTTGTTPTYPIYHEQQVSAGEADTHNSYIPLSYKSQEGSYATSQHNTQSMSYQHPSVSTYSTVATTTTTTATPIVNVYPRVVEQEPNYAVRQQANQALPYDWISPWTLSTTTPSPPTYGTTYYQSTRPSTYSQPVESTTRAAPPPVTMTTTPAPSYWDNSGPASAGLPNHPPTNLKPHEEGTGYTTNSQIHRPYVSPIVHSNPGIYAQRPSTVPPVKLHEPRYVYYPKRPRSRKDLVRDPRTGLLNSPPEYRPRPKPIVMTTTIAPLLSRIPPYGAPYDGRARMDPVSEYRAQNPIGRNAAMMEILMPDAYEHFHGNSLEYGSYQDVRPRQYSNGHDRPDHASWEVVNNVGKCRHIAGACYLRDPGLYPHPNRRCFIQCDYAGGSHVQECPPGTLWGGTSTRPAGYNMCTAKARAHGAY
ncbi:flocculation protein FLO11-like [Lingula anatina]|uniref:Flocculation protein FLO11-like n=1 Tax=Lingula anatina TaxID=7574 RepID=A0A1S3K3Z1_LINAN|nr:flocculation protein FLO11-like [Lingula anatina]|eukprot:XP_013417345.1 flocculation protein FLO11-like [Lingula anatina]